MRQLLRSALVAMALAALPAVSAEADVAAGSKTLTAGDVSATLSWQDGTSFGEKAHIAIDRTGSQTFEADLIDACKVCGELPDPSHDLTVRDLDGDGEPEVLVDNFSGGAHCCYVTVIYWFDGTTYQHRVSLWGDPTYKLEDLNGDGKPEFVTADDRFAYEFAAYAFSYLPPLIYDFVGDKLTDVTRQHPKRILADIHYIDKALPGTRKDGDARGLIAGRMADLALLGQRSHIGPYLAKALKRGYLNGDGLWPAGKKFKPALLKFLRKLHYIK